MLVSCSSKCVREIAGKPLGPVPQRFYGRCWHWTKRWPMMRRGPARRRIDDQRRCWVFPRFPVGPSQHTNLLTLERRNQEEKHWASALMWFADVCSLHCDDWWMKTIDHQKLMVLYKKWSLKCVNSYFNCDPYPIWLQEINDDGGPHVRLKHLGAMSHRSHCCLGLADGLGWWLDNLEWWESHLDFFASLLCFQDLSILCYPDWNCISATEDFVVQLLHFFCTFL